MGTDTLINLWKHKLDLGDWDIIAHQVDPEYILQPDEIPNLEAWYDGSDNSTFTLAGSLVTQWNDKSGNGWHLSNSITAEKPTRAENSVYFEIPEGTQLQRLNNVGFSALDGANTYTVAILAKPDSQPWIENTKVLFNLLPDASPSFGDGLTISYKAPENEGRGNHIVGASTDISSNPEIINFANPLYYILRRSAAENNQKLITKTVTPAGAALTAPALPTTPQTLTAGNFANAEAGFKSWFGIEGWIYQFIIYSKALNETELRGLKGFLNSKS